MNGIDMRAAISKYVLNCSDCCALVGLDHKKGTGKAEANQIIESMMIILRDRFFFWSTVNLSQGSINLIRLIT